MARLREAKPLGAASGTLRRIRWLAKEIVVTIGVMRFSRLRSSGRCEGLYEVFHSFPLPTTGFFLQVFRKLLQGRP